MKPDIETALFFVADVNGMQDKPTGIVKQRNAYELKVINRELPVNSERKIPGLLYDIQNYSGHFYSSPYINTIYGT